MGNLGLSITILSEVNCKVLKRLAEKVQSVYDDDPCLSAFMEVQNNPESTQEDVDLAVVQRNECIANLRNERLNSAITTDPSAPETLDEFDKYVAKYGDSTLHNYEGAPDVAPTSLSLTTMSGNSARDEQFAEWAAGCGSAPEFLWMRGDICPCDCKRMYYVDNGVSKEDRGFFILPDGKNPASATNVFNKKNVKIVINGKLVETKNLVTSGQEYNITANIADEQTIAGNLKSKTFFTSSIKKQQFLLAQV